MILHTHGFETSLLALAVRSSSVTTRWLYTHHHQPGFFDLAPTKPWKRNAANRLDRLMARHADGIVAPSRPVVESLLAGRAEPQKVHLMPIGFDTEAIQLRSTRTTPDQIFEGPGPHVLSVGRLSWEKAHDSLLHAWPTIVQAHPTARLLLVGVGPLRQSLVDLASALGVGHSVTLLGERSDVPVLMARATLLAHTALTESFGQVIAEAMLLGLPVVATAVGLAADLDDGELCFRIPRDDPRRMADVILRVIGDPRSRARVAANAHAYAMQHFTLDANAQRLYDLYRSLMPISARGFS